MKTGYAEAIRRGAATCVKMDGDGQVSAEDVGDSRRRCWKERP